MRAGDGPIAVLGATGTIGRAVVHRAAARGWTTRALVRRDDAIVPGEVRQTDTAALTEGDLRGCTALISCLAARDGAPAAAWAIDHRAQVAAFQAAARAGLDHVVLLSAICVQKPRLPFQFAKRAAEAALAASGLPYSVVRPTAFFKSLSGQVARVAAGRPFMVLGDGRQTACLPISDRDLADYLLDCLVLPARAGRVLPIGGPGDPVTPRGQAELLSRLTGRPLRLRRVPRATMAAIAGGLAVAGRAVPRLRGPANLAAIGQYYATESMLVWDDEAGRYDADATPRTGQDRLEDHYRALLRGEGGAGLGVHAVF